MSKRIPPTAILAVLIIANGICPLRPTVAAALQQLESSQVFSVSSDMVRTNSLQPSARERRSLNSSVDVLITAGLSFRLPVRASRWSFGSFARGCNQGLLSASVSDSSSQAHESENALAFQALQTTFTPITPPFQRSSENQDSPVDQTLAAHPTIFLRMPNLPSGIVDFTVQNEAGTEQLYETTFELTRQEEGIVGIQIPQTALPLEVGQTYAWQVMVTALCPQAGHTFRLHTGSWIERVAMGEEMAVAEQVEMRDRPSLYAEAGLWVDTISTLATLRLQNPNDATLNESWASLMESVSLNEFATESVLYIYDEGQYGEEQ